MFGIKGALNHDHYISSICCRFKHSRTQLKRLFKNNPAFIRAVSRNQVSSKYSAPLCGQITPFFKPNFIPNGWSEPPSDKFTLLKRDHIPFVVRRTGNKPNGGVGFIPVYSSIRLGGTKHTTIIKRVTGDRETFLDELRRVLGIPVDDDNAIRSRASGSTIEVNGNRVREVKTWLASLGF